MATFLGLNSVGPDQIAPEMALWSGAAVYAIPKQSFRHFIR